MDYAHRLLVTNLINFSSSHKRILWTLAFNIELRLVTAGVVRFQLSFAVFSKI